MSSKGLEHPAVQEQLDESREEVLRTLFPDGLAGQRIIDLGCGGGDFLALLMALGAEQDLVEGLDLDADDIAEASRRFSQARFRCARLEDAELGEAVFDIAVLSQVMSQIRDPEDRRQILRATAGALKGNGRILIHDMLRIRPRSRRRGMRRFGPDDLARMLPPGLVVHSFRRCTLFPPLMRLIAPRAPRLSRGLCRFPALLGHWMALLQVEVEN